MPELPEVETIARGLYPALVGKTILSADLRCLRTLAEPSPAGFVRRVQGQRITDVTRRAKFLRLHLSKDNLLIHLRMSGDLLIKDGDYVPQKHDRLVLTLSHHSALIFTDPRKFGRVWLTADPDEVLGGLGPEPLDPTLTPQMFCERLHARRRRLKPLLLDQTFIAGLGNIYTDEALHQAGLHPLTPSQCLSTAQAETLLQSIREALETGLRHNGASIDWVYRGGEFQHHFRVYGRDGQPCPVCGATIKRLTIGQRGTHFCPKCQPLTG